MVVNKFEIITLQFQEFEKSRAPRDHRSLTKTKMADIV